MTSRIVLALLILTTLAFGLFGIDRSLWMDEAWVANSVRQPTLGGMFYYPGWLQTSPPLFLLLQRAAVTLMGLSNASFRLIPLTSEIAAVVLIFVALLRVVPLPFAALAAVVVASHPVAIEYSRTCKQYSGEMAASAAVLAATVAYLETRSVRWFWLLLLTVCIGLTLSYPLVFLIPGVAIAARPRGIWLALSAGGVLAVLYAVFIQPNYSPALREFWSLSPTWTGGMVFVLAVCGAGFLGRGRNPMLLPCALPGLLLAVAAALGWYPATTRTWLFILPCLVMIGAILAAKFLTVRLVWIADLAIPMFAGWRQIHHHRNLPEEDFAGAVRFLQEHAEPSDLLLVHPSVKEGFELYSAMEDFHTPQPVYGATGWPCCVRDLLAPPHSSSKQAVIDDLEAKIPREFTGRVWLVYSSRPTQWDYTGLDEGNLWRSQAWTMGCAPEEFHAFSNVALSPMNCTGRLR